MSHPHSNETRIVSNMSASLAASRRPMSQFWASSQVLRLRGLHHRSAVESVSSEISRYPVVGHEFSRSARRPHVTDQSLPTPCGRSRTRIRHLHRTSRLRVLGPGLLQKWGTVNTAGLDWSRTDNAEKLLSLLNFVRERSWDFAFLTELHFSTQSVVYIEEFTLVLSGRVGILMNIAGRMAWNRAGSQVIPYGERMLGVPIAWPAVAQPILLVSIYSPTGVSLLELAAHYQQAYDLHLLGRQFNMLQFWSGDWNGHVGRDFLSDGVHSGAKALQQATTRTGKEQRRWLHATDLVCVDSQREIIRRATWRHRNGQWYELDYACCSPPVAAAVRRARALPTSFSDHRAKEYELVFAQPASHDSRRDRKARFLARQQQRAAEAFHQRGPLNFQALRGPTAEAADRRARYSKRVQELLCEARALQPPHHEKFPTRLDDYHIYTDGSGEGSGGWGIQIFRGPAEAATAASTGIVDLSIGASFYGPIVTTPQDPYWLGADASTNNTGELSAIGMAMVLLLSSDGAPATVYYDSRYAAQVAQGLWQPATNVQLARRVRKLVRAVRVVRPLRFLHVKGHSGVWGNEAADAGARRGARGEQCLPPEPPPTEVRRRRRRKGPPDEEPEPSAAALQAQALPWSALSQIAVQAVEEVCGRGVRHPRGAPYLADDLTRAQALRAVLRQTWEALRVAPAGAEEWRARAAHRAARRALERHRCRSRHRYVRAVCRSLEEALHQHDLSGFYAGLRRFGLHLDERSSRGKEPHSLAEIRDYLYKLGNEDFEFDASELEMGLPAVHTNEAMDRLPTEEEILGTLQTVRETAPGKDEVTALMLKEGGEMFRAELVHVIRALWVTDPVDWDPVLHSALGRRLYKKGLRTDVANYRTIWLISLLTRLLAKIVANRLSQHAETVQLFPEHSWGFRSNRSVVGPLFILRLLLESNNEVDLASPDVEPLVIGLYDITRAYPRVPNDAAQQVLQRSGVPGRMCRRIEGFHRLARYQVWTSEGLSEPFRMQRGFKEGCPSSPVTFNYYHSHSTAAFYRRARLLDPLPGVRGHVDTSLPIGRRVRRLPEEWAQLPQWELLLLLFADDTTLVTRESGWEAVEELLLTTLARWGEDVHPGKTERLRAGSPADEQFSSHARFLGGWLAADGSQSEDTRRRIAAAERIWRRLFQQLPRLRLSPSMLGLVIRCTVVACMMYGLEARAVHGEHLRQMQCFMNKVVMGLSGQRRREMHDDQLTLQDLRRRFGLDLVSTTLAWHQQRFIGHLARLPPERLERQALWLALSPESSLPRGRAGGAAITTRGQLWRRVEEVLSALRVPCDEWRSTWLDVAADRHRWRKGMKAHRRLLRQRADADTWAARHAPGGRAEARDRRRAERAALLEAAPAELVTDIRCPHCPALWPNRYSWARHVQACVGRTAEQRAAALRTQALREARNRRRRAAAGEAPQLTPTVVVAAAEPPAAEVAAHPPDPVLAPARGPLAAVAAAAIVAAGARAAGPAGRALAGALAAAAPVGDAAGPRRVLRRPAAAAAVVADPVPSVAAPSRVPHSAGDGGASAAAGPSLARVRRRIRGKRPVPLAEMSIPKTRHRIKKRPAAAAAPAPAVHPEAPLAAHPVPGVRARAGAGTWSRRAATTPPAGWQGKLALSVLDARILDDPPPPRFVARGCNGECSICRQCVRCRKKCCLGGWWQGLGCSRCKNCRVCRVSADDAEYAALQAKLQRGGRLGSVADLPAPPWPAGAQKGECPYCHLHFRDDTHSASHRKTCSRMPYDMWLSRLRIVQDHMAPAASRTHLCRHCGTGFADARGTTVHERGCAARRQLFGLPLDRRTFHHTPADAAGMPAGWDR
mmetsp:Transcript_102993/g.296578  ORF Transcript_102993/g.296578 Transcript_102993/m.296578 type:complete len:1838 (+) Transcript_102993:1524-7037(+)